MGKIDFKRLSSVLSDNQGISLGAALGGLGTVMLAEPIIDDVGDVIRTRYTSINQPVWSEMGKTQLYSDYSSLPDFTRRFEALLKLKYDKPVDIGGSLAEDAVKNLGKAMKDVSNDYKAMRAFDKIENTPQVRALGREKARQIFDQVAAISPNVIRKAPNVALSIMNDAIMTDSTALRPETAQNLARAASELSKI